MSDPNIPNQEQEEIQKEEETSKREEHQEEEKKDEAKIKEEKPIETRKSVESMLPAMKMSLDANTLTDAFAERKKKNYLEVKTWDERRIKIVRLHRSTMDLIFDTIDKKLSASKSSMEVILKFFNDTVERETESIKFVKTKMTKVGNAYFNPENPKEAVFPKLSKALSVVDDASASRLKFMEDFILFVNKTILKETLGVEITEYEKGVGSFKQTISALKKSLFKINSEIATVCAKFTKSQDSSGSKKKDLYGIQIMYFSKVQSHFQILRSIAKETYEFLKMVVNLEKKRKDSICKSFHLFLSKGNEIYGKSFLSEMTAKHFDSLAMDAEVESHYDLNQFVPISTFNEISTATGLTINDTASLKKFLEEYSLEEISDKLLVLKQVDCAKDCGSITRSYKSVKAIVTVDKNLLIVDKSNACDVKILNFLDLSKCKTNDKNDPSVLEIIEKLPGIFYSSNTKVHLKFEHSDTLMEIKNYMETLQNMIGV